MTTSLHIAIVRHGKAKPDVASGVDADRDLKSRGERQAAFLATELAERMPGAAVFTSPAIRARRTAEPIAAALDVDLEFDDRLFTDADPGLVLELVAERVARDPSEPLVLVGHNPTLARVVGFLQRGVAGDVDLKTGMAVVLTVDRDNPAAPGAAQLVTILRAAD
jgi:phosphohistidine phosphatase SixA